MGVLLNEFEASQAEKSNALGLLAAAADPQGTRERIEELAAAQQAHEQAAEAASAAVTAAQAAKAEADARLAEAARVEEWCQAEQARLKASGVNIASHHADLDKKRSELAAIGDRLDARAREQKAFISSVKAFLENAESAKA